MNRTITFGKYKGQAIKELILEHQGYIYWCLSNLNWFKLNEEEQALYDALAIANIKYEMKFPFPVKQLAEHIKNKKALDTLDTPFIIKWNGIIGYRADEVSNPIIQDALPYKKKVIDTPQPKGAASLVDINHTFNKIEAEAHLKGWDEDDDLYLGNNPYSIIE